MEELIYKDVCKYLSARQKKLLKLWLDRYSLRDMQKRLGLSKQDIFLEFIYLGQKLGFYKILSTKFYCTDKDTKVIIGFEKAIKAIKKVLKQEIKFSKKK